MNSRDPEPCDVPRDDHDGEVRFYATGWKCDRHSPWAARGLPRPAPGPGAIYTYRAAPAATDHQQNGPAMTTHTLPHAPYIDAIEGVLTECGLAPEQADAFVEDSYDVPYLRGVITLTPETSGIPAGRYRHGLILIWDWHTGRDHFYDRGPVWQWARLNEDGSNRDPEPLPVPGWVMPAMLAGAVATLAHTGTATPMTTGWHQHLRVPVEDAIQAWSTTR